MREMEDSGIVLGSMTDMNEWMALYNDLHNHTRMPFNRGHCPQEMMGKMKPSRKPPMLSFGPGLMKMIEDGEMDGQELISRIEKMGVNVDSRTKAQAGRNELCPCGSGKKYKKCCGKVN